MYNTNYADEFKVLHNFLLWFIGFIWVIGLYNLKRYDLENKKEKEL